MTKKLPTLTKLENALQRYNTGPGITADSLAKVARVNRCSITQRIAELRESYKIYTNYRKVNGKRTAFYRFAGELN
jgi:hypothetical protein